MGWPALSGRAQKAEAGLAALGFLSGRWTSDSPDGMEEEYWSQAMGSSMVGTFRVVKDGAAVFYEFWAIEIEDGKAVFKMKHFNRGLIGWEEKADMVRLVTTAGPGNEVLFARPDGSLSLRYVANGEELVSTLRRVKEGKVMEETFHLHRAR
jgi:hypothetical protein